MKLEIIGTNFVNVDTAQILVRQVRDYDFGIKTHRDSLHKLLDCFIDQCISHNTFEKHDTFSIEFRSYRQHTDLKLSF